MPLILSSWGLRASTGDNVLVLHVDNHMTLHMVAQAPQVIPELRARSPEYSWVSPTPTPTTKEKKEKEKEKKEILYMTLSFWTLHFFLLVVDGW